LAVAGRMPQPRFQGASHHLAQGRAGRTNQHHESPWFGETMIGSPGGGGDNLLHQFPGYRIGFEFPGAVPFAERSDYRVFVAWKGYSSMPHMPVAIRSIPTFFFGPPGNTALQATAGTTE